MRQRLIEFRKLLYPGRTKKIRIFDNIFRNFLNRRLGAVHDTQINEHNRFIASRQLPTPKPPIMIRQPEPTRNDKHNMKVRMICTSIRIASNLKHTQPAEQVKMLKVTAHSKTMPSIRHISQTRSKRINRNITNGKREKDKTATRILGFNPFETLIVLAK